jgi:hypothetical protein
MRPTSSTSPRIRSSLIEGKIPLVSLFLAALPPRPANQGQYQGDSGTHVPVSDASLTDIGWDGNTCAPDLRRYSVFQKDVVSACSVSFMSASCASHRAGMSGVAVDRAQPDSAQSEKQRRRRPPRTTKPGPSAMALTNTAGDVFCHAERRGPQRGSRVGVALRVCDPDAPGR